MKDEDLVCPKCGHKEFARDYSETVFGSETVTFIKDERWGIVDDVNDVETYDSNDYENGVSFTCKKCLTQLNEENLVYEKEWERAEKVRLLDADQSKL